MALMNTVTIPKPAFAKQGWFSYQLLLVRVRVRVLEQALTLPRMFVEPELADDPFLGFD